MKLAPGSTISARSLLFDMDGTLVDSTAVVERVWKRWAYRRGLDFEAFRHTMHGQRAIDTMREILAAGGKATAGLDLARELRAVDDDELTETAGIVPIPGAARLLASLPRDAWALVTSANLALARTRMSAAGLPLPEIIVSAEDIQAGKPDPACYRLALARLGQAPADAVVFEDAAAGLAAGRAAGCRTIALATTLPPASLADENWLADFTPLVFEKTDGQGRLLLRIRAD